MWSWVLCSVPLIYIFSPLQYTSLYCCIYNVIHLLILLLQKLFLTTLVLLFFHINFINSFVCSYKNPWLNFDKNYVKSIYTFEENWQVHCVESSNHEHSISLHFRRVYLLDTEFWVDNSFLLDLKYIVALPHGIYSLWWEIRSHFSLVSCSSAHVQFYFSSVELFLWF